MEHASDSDSGEDIDEQLDRTHQWKLKRVSLLVNLLHAAIAKGDDEKILRVLSEVKSLNLLIQAKADLLQEASYRALYSPACDADTVWTVCEAALSDAGVALSGKDRPGSSPSFPWSILETACAIRPDVVERLLVLAEIYGQDEDLPNDLEELPEIAGLSQDDSGSRKAFLAEAKALQSAASGGDEAAVRRIIEGSSGAQRTCLLETCDVRGRTPLLYASREGHLGIVEILLGLENDGVSISHTDMDGISALGWAVCRSHSEVVRRLLAAGVALRWDSGMHFGLLKTATMLRNQGIVQALMEHLPWGDSTVTAPALAEAASSGYVHILDLLLASVLRESGTFHEASLSAALSAACQHGQWKAVRRLVEAGAAVNMPSTEHTGNTPLCQALQRGNRKCALELLQSNRVHLDQQDFGGRTYLHRCVFTFDRWGAEVLLRAGINKWSKTSAGETNEPWLSASDLAKYRMGESLAKFIDSFQLTLQERCMCVIRRSLPSSQSLRHTVPRLPLPGKVADRLLFGRLAMS